ncbi:demethylmenaquinone methyltransferase [bacterium BMS3Abin04]|nr:demethylmenaquinone methyltransferase [bacterium BMS3Abin04]
MKILESRPERYDTGINFLSGGHAAKIRKQIVRNFIKPGMKMLDIGCGTGLLIEDAAKAGAEVKGIDISAGMLKVAQKRIGKSGLQDKISIYNAGVVEIDTIFTENSFDVIVSTLVFSELYSEERALVLYQIKKLLKPNGKLVIAVEVQPDDLFKRIAHFFVRLPLTVLTYIIAQTGTKPLTDISDEVIKSGFSIIKEERSFLDSFIILSANNSENTGYVEMDLPAVKKPGDDYSIIKSIWDYIGRWFPNPVEPGLRITGNPGRSSPVILTSNFHLTVRRVEKSLKNENVFLLIAPTNGINVWCAAEGGDLNTHSVITAIKTSRLNERVDHNKIILPQFSASGIDLKLLKKETGRKGLFGPAYSKSIPKYLKNHKTVFENNKADFSLPFRLEMLLSMNFIIWFVIAIVTLFTAPEVLLPVSIYFWLTGFVLYAGYPIIPGKSGWLKAGILSIIEIIAIALYTFLILKMPGFAYWKIMLGTSAINLWLGFDLKGIVAGYPSEAERLMKKLGMKSFGHIFSAEKQNEGLIQQDIGKCNNCRICLMVCPKGVFDIVEKKNIRIKNQSECFACNACVTQCTENALLLGK